MESEIREYFKDFTNFKQEILSKFEIMQNMIISINNKLDNTVTMDIEEEMSIVTETTNSQNTKEIDTAWKKPKFTFKEKSKSETDLHKINLTNNFTPLEHEKTTNRNCESCDVFNILAESKNVVSVTNKRPPVVINKSPENDVLQTSRHPITTVPGPRAYNRAHIMDTLIVSDSMMNRVNRRQILNNIDQETENVTIKKFPGATSSEISHYACHPLQQLKPHRIIVVAGTNDLSPHLNDGIVDVNKVVSDILHIGKVARTFGVKEIYISGIIRRQGPRYKKIIENLNILLQGECIREGYNFIDQSFINYVHLDNDGLHLNSYGQVILKMSIMECFNTFNPYLNDFIDFYDRAV